MTCPVHSLITTLASAFVLGCLISTTPAQESAPTTQPAERQPITARVLEVRGDAKHAPLESTDWR